MEPPPNIVADAESSRQSPPHPQAPADHALAASTLRELLGLDSLWLVADVDDAARLDMHGFPARCLTDEDPLTRTLVTPLKHLIVLQRPGADGAAFGVHVKRRLQALHWHGSLIRAFLPDPYSDLAIVERETAPDRFGPFLASLAASGDREFLRLPPRTKATKAPPADHEAPEMPFGRPQVVTMSDVQAEAVQWLWWPYIAIGKLCMLDGDPGIGKSLLTTQLAASLSKGHQLPDQQGKPTLDPGGPQTTLLLSSEDGLADTIKPRLEAAGADCTRVHVMTGWLGAEDKFHQFTLKHMPVLEAAIQQYRPRLLVIDPIQAYLGDVDMHRANETRPLLAALTRLAEAYHCASVCIRHPSKPGQGGGKAIHRGLGSIDFIGAARTGLFVEQHPTDAGKVLMAQSKSNIGPLGRTQVYSKSQGLFEWCGVSRLSAELMAGSVYGPERHMFFEVFCWLETHMIPGVPRASKDIEEELEEEGYRGDTIKRVKKALGIVSFREGERWFWKLPDLPVLSPPPPPFTSSTSSTPSTSSTSSTSSPSVKSITYNQVGQEDEEDEVAEEDEVEGVVSGNHGQAYNPHNGHGGPICAHGEAGQVFEGAMRLCGLCLGMSAAAVARLQRCGEEGGTT